MGITQEIAKFVVRTDEGKIPGAVYEHAKVAFADWLSVALAGKDDPLVDKLVRLADLMGGKEQATLIGRGVKKTALQAALINGSASHALDYDDTSDIYHGHPSVTLFPALLALSEWKEKRGKDLLTAYIVGFQAGAAVGVCTGIEHYLSGWHATSTLGHLASAAACAHLLGLREREVVYALGIAGTQASGLKGVFGTMSKPFHAGKSSQGGLMSALLAEDGFTSAEDILEGRFGFFQVLKGRFEPDALEMLGKRWAIENLAQKYHASCHGTHSPIEATLGIVEKHQLPVDRIQAVQVLSSQLALDAANKAAPRTGLEGKFSISYCITNALLRGDTGTGAFTDEKVNEPRIRTFMEKVSVGASDKFKGLESEVIVKTATGETYSSYADILKDVPELEAKKVKIAAKFRGLCRPVLGSDRTEELLERVFSLDRADGVGDVMALTDERRTA